jgi:PilZ domain
MRLPMDDVARPALWAADLRRLGARLEHFGYPVAEVASDGLYSLLVDRGSGSRAAIVHAALAAAGDTSLEAATGRLRALAPSRRLTLLAWGKPPSPSGRRRLGEAGVELNLYEPLGEAVLRFQVNRALAPHPAPKRRAPRAPVEIEIALRARLRTRSARVYSLSASGAYVLTDEPLRPGRRMTLEVPVAPLRPRARARVVLSNPPAGPTSLELPPGMALAFEDMDAASAAVINRLVEERLATLAV